MNASNRLELKNVSKSFPGCKANDNVSLHIAPGEIHALLGENGAGKSTLVKMIYGLLQPDEGSIIWHGQTTQILSPKIARNLGIGMVFQHFSLFDALTVSENIAVGLDKSIPFKELDKKIIDVSKSYGLTLNPSLKVGDLSVGERQRVEIVRCLLQQPQLLIMDEPTSVLTPQEAEILFKTLKQLSSEGISILYISHKLEEIKQLCDRATILRGGKFIEELSPQDYSIKQMAEMMVGSKINPPSRNQNGHFGEVALNVKDLNLSSSQPFGNDLKNVNFSIRAGEILGIAGMAGNGQTELLSALSGEADTEIESIVLHGRPSGNLPSNQRRMIGMAYVPEERLGHGSVPQNALHENAFLSGYHSLKMHKYGLIDFAKRDEFTQSVCDKYNVKHSGIHSEAQSLSGGNLQKFIVGREIEQAPSILIAAQPTWGVDAGAAADIHQALINLAEQGCAILLLSQDLDELFTLSDSISVIFEGTVSDSYPVNQISRQEIGLLMSGSSIISAKGGHSSSFQREAL